MLESAAHVLVAKRQGIWKIKVYMIIMRETYIFNLIYLTIKCVLMPYQSVYS